MADGGFLSRWSRLKAEARTRPAGAPAPAAPEAPAAATASGAGARLEGQAMAVPGRPVAADADASATGQSAAAARATEPLPTLDDALRLDARSDYSAFVARGVDTAVRRVALRRLFADPHFNTMDGLDVYIGDYTRADPVAPAMLDSLRRAAGLLRDAGAPRPNPQAAAGQAGPPDKENDEH